MADVGIENRQGSKSSNSWFNSAEDAARAANYIRQIGLTSSRDTFESSSTKRANPYEVYHTKKSQWDDDLKNNFINEAEYNQRHLEGVEELSKHFKWDERPRDQKVNYLSNLTNPFTYSDDQINKAVLAIQHPYMQNDLRNYLPYIAGTEFAAALKFLIDHKGDSDKQFFGKPYEISYILSQINLAFIETNLENAARILNLVKHFESGIQKDLNDAESKTTEKEKNSALEKVETKLKILNVLEYVSLAVFMVAAVVSAIVTGLIPALFLPVSLPILLGGGTFGLTTAGLNLFFKHKKQTLESEEQAKKIDEANKTPKPEPKMTIASALKTIGHSLYEKAPKNPSTIEPEVSLADEAIEYWQDPGFQFPGFQLT